MYKPSRSPWRRGLPSASPCVPQELSSCHSPFPGLCSLPQQEGSTQRIWIQPTLSTVSQRWSFTPPDSNRNGFLQCLPPWQLQDFCSLALRSPSVILLCCLPWLLCSLFSWKHCPSTSLVHKVLSRELLTSAGKTSHPTSLQVHKSVYIFCSLQNKCSLLYLRTWAVMGKQSKAVNTFTTFTVMQVNFPKYSSALLQWFSFEWKSLKCIYLHI